MKRYVKINKITDNKRMIAVIVEGLNWQFLLYDIVYQNTVGIITKQIKFWGKEENMVHGIAALG